MILPGSRSQSTRDPSSFGTRVPPVPVPLTSTCPVSAPHFARTLWQVKTDARIAKGFVQVKGGTCAGNNPQGLKVQILDNNIWQPVSGSSGSTAGNTSASTLSAAVGGNSIAAAVVQPPATLVSSNSPAIAASSAPAPTTPATPPTAPAAPSGNAGNIKAAVVGSPAKTPR